MLGAAATPSAGGTETAAWATTLIWVAGWLAGAIVVGLLIHALLFVVLRIVATRINSALLAAVCQRLRAPSRVLFPALLLQFSVGSLDLSDEAQSLVAHGLSLALIGALTWLGVSFIAVAQDVFLSKYRIDVADNLRARQVHTQVKVLSRVLGVLLVVIAVAGALMTFPQVRQIGASILASAGIAGLILGLAARPLATNLIAGVQIAMAQPIQIDDVLIVEGEWGRVEEITPTYVVVKIWDDRRLVVPLTYFIDKPFQNWTRRTAQLLGTAFIYADYRVPVATVREELKRILDSTDLWDKRGWALQVTDCKEGTVELRALMSAKDAPTAFELRCLVRERLIAFLQREHPYCLPRVRAEIEERRRTDEASEDGRIVRREPAASR